MPSFQTLRHAPYAPEAMLELVADVARYPEFVPLCDGLNVLSRMPGENGSETIIARMSVGYGPIRESFTSRIEVSRRLRQIDVSYLDGPFRSLRNRWLFRASRGGCDIDFDIRYEFRSLALQLLLGAMFDRAFRKFAEAFEARARTVHGPPRDTSDQGRGDPVATTVNPAVRSALRSLP